MAKKPDFLSDSPITDEDQDWLRRTDFVRGLYKEIVLLPSGDSFCFGIYGSWGEGKSSILNLLRNPLEKNSSIILFEFDPWYLSTKEVVLKNFLEGLERVLRPSFPRKSKKDLKKYFRKLSLGVTVLGTGGHIGYEFEKEGLLDLKREISNKIEKTEKKLVILIDDIDRLEPDEILLVFKLVKLIANFKNTVFVVNFDVKAVENSLKTKSIAIGYIEKIIQKPIPLPKIEQPYIDSFLQYGLNSIFENLRIDKKDIEVLKKEFFPIYLQYCNKFFTTLRSVKRYLSSTSSSLPPVVTEINLRDFLLLEIIKVFSPKLYDDIYENWFFYVSQMTAAGEISIHEMLLPPGIGKEDEFKNRIKDHLNQLLADEPKKETFINLLASLFPLVNDAFNAYATVDTSKARQEKRIHSTSFLKYFTFRPPQKEKSDYYIQEMVIKSWNECDVERLPELLDKTFSGENLELLNKLSIFRSEISPSIVPILIRSLSKNSAKFSAEGEGSTERFMAETLVVDLLKEKIYVPKEIQSILEKVIAFSTFCFASSVYLDCKSSNKNQPDKKWAVLESIRQTLMNRFNESFVEPQKDFFLSDEPAYVLFRLWDLSAEVEAVSRKESSISEYVWRMLNNNPKYFGRIINSFIPRPRGTTKSLTRSLRLDGRDLAKYFNIDQLYKQIKEASQNTFESKEEKEAVEFFQKLYEESKIYEEPKEDTSTS